MKYFLFSLLLVVQSHSLFASVVKKRAVVRDENFHAVIEEVTLPDLTSDNSYEGKYFKIVDGKNDEAIRFDDSEDLQVRAATTYYHLNRAHKYWTDVVKSDYVKEMPQIIVRINLTNVYNEVGHFANDKLDPQFNNALSVPAGKGYEPKNIGPWGNEIWFRPSKEINIKDFKGVVDYGGGMKASLTAFRNQTHMSNLEQFMITLLGAATNGASPNVGNLMRLAGSSVLLEVIYQTSDIAAEYFSRKIYRLDTAMVPEIIYHEFSHIALSDHLELSHSTPVNEGLADYFAGKIANSKQLATKIKDYNLFSGKKVEKKQQYRSAFEQGQYANADFVFGLLWNVGDTVGEDIAPKFVFDMTRNLTTNVNIRDDLINSTLNVCKSDCKDPMNDRFKLYKLYNSKNL